MKAVEKMGLLKMDFLGLTTLTVIDDCLKLIRRPMAKRWIWRRCRWTHARCYEQVFHQGAHLRRFSV